MHGWLLRETGSKYLRRDSTATRWRGLGSGHAARRHYQKSSAWDIFLLRVVSVPRIARVEPSINPGRSP